MSAPNFYAGKKHVLHIVGGNHGDTVENLRIWSVHNKEYYPDPLYEGEFVKVAAIAPPCEQAGGSSVMHK